MLLSRQRVQHEEASWCSLHKYDSTWTGMVFNDQPCQQINAHAHSIQVCKFTLLPCDVKADRHVDAGILWTIIQSFPQLWICVGVGLAYGISRVLKMFFLKTPHQQLKRQKKYYNSLQPLKHSIYIKKKSLSSDRPHSLKQSLTDLQFLLHEIPRNM